MAHALFKSLFLYSALAASAVLAAPAHQHQAAPLARDVSPREFLHSLHLFEAEPIIPVPAGIGQRSQEQGGGPTKIANAMRIANGLPPLAPRRLFEGFLSAFRYTTYKLLIHFMTLTIETEDDGSGADPAHQVRSSPKPIS